MLVWILVDVFELYFCFVKGIYCVNNIGLRGVFRLVVMKVKVEVCVDSERNG